MSKHTPGPWEIKNQNLVAEGGNCVLANLHMWQGDAPDEGKANARLIAAAPELLAALQAMFRAAEMRDMDNCEVRSAHVAVEWDAANQAARAAIVKAESK